jgi:hypothetical protein
MIRDRTVIGEPPIRYYVEPLEGRRGQMHADLLDRDGTVVTSWRVGSPAPIESVRAALPACDRRS